ncbi:hypothetical protein Scep_009971 [Stephania cephalantha]|uniref:Uncharacterized protein n=1 Tax=Stephania cephalantha TaxID=152367 RepID=A0AAP0PGN1_9MAGN
MQWTEYIPYVCTIIMKKMTSKKERIEITQIINKESHMTCYQQRFSTCFAFDLGIECLAENCLEELHLIMKKLTRKQKRIERVCLCV